MSVETTSILPENVETPATLKSLARLKLPVPVNLAYSKFPLLRSLNIKFPAALVLPKAFHSKTVFFTFVLWK